jgi:FkbM family methyltransferase
MDYKKYKDVKVVEDIDDVYAIVTCKGFNFKIRKNKIDAFTVNEVFKCGYLKHLKLDKQDIVLDIGMNIGVFSVIASRHCEKVIGFEPDIENYNLAKTNLELNNINNVEIFNSAITDKNEQINLYLNSGVCSDCHTTYPVRGRQSVIVDAKGINNVIEDFNPTKLKIDCEGEELNFMQIANLNNIKAISMEVHFSLSKRDKHERYYKMLKNIENNLTNVKYPKVQDKFSKILVANNF